MATTLIGASTTYKSHDAVSAMAGRRCGSGFSYLIAIDVT